MTKMLDVDWIIQELLGINIYSDRCVTKRRVRKSLDLI